MKVIKTPWKKEFLELVSCAKSSIKITSPYIKENVCNDMLQAKQNKSKIELITSFKLMSIYSGSLDLSALENIIKQNGHIRNYSKLHSKIYLFDDKKAIITSSNLTNGGLLKNYEYGIYIDEKEIVSQITNDFNLISKDENTGTIKSSDIKTVKEILSKIPKIETIKLPKFKIETPEEKFDVIEIPNNSITSSLSGWKLEVFNCLIEINQTHFSLNDLKTYETHLNRRFPKNNNVLAKVRQQLQYLRDLGLIEFLGNGNYKKLWK